MQNFHWQTHVSLLCPESIQLSSATTINTSVDTLFGLIYMHEELKNESRS